MLAMTKLFVMEICGFEEEAAEEITTTQGYDALDKFCLLGNKGVDNICSIER
jgi:hypothetical protein